MRDAALEFWTTPPNVFLVATNTSGMVVGCISYRIITPDTAEMHRLTVDSKSRGLGIGRKLVQELLDNVVKNAEKPV